MQDRRAPGKGLGAVTIFVANRLRSSYYSAREKLCACNPQIEVCKSWLFPLNAERKSRNVFS